MKTLFFVLLGVAFVVSLQRGSVYFDKLSQRYSYKPYYDPNNAVAYGSFDDGLMETGWGVLNIATNPKYGDAQQMYAAGFLEGVLTNSRIYDHYQNIHNVFASWTPGFPSQKVLNFYDQQSEWVNAQIQANPSSPLWMQVSFIQAHLDGLVGGYQSAAPSDKMLDAWAFQVLQGTGDLLDLMPALEPRARVDWEHMEPKERFQAFTRKGHCSGLIKVTDDLSDLMAAHSSWFVFSATNRIYKHYNFDLNSPFVAAKKMSFSSYAGFLESLDDFYMMDSGLAMVQTTNSILNQSIYEYVQPQSLWAWQRVRLANALAHSGEEWANIVSQYNSGTYNNQYMVVDYKRFIPKQGLLDGTLWVVEQIPGLVESADVTNILNLGYWPSYNVPYFETIYNLSGYPSFVEKYGTDYSYQLAPRAQIFRRDQGTVVDIPSLKAMMRYNDYLHDPIANGDPMKAICSRGDLEPSGGSPDGCYDSKVTNYAWFQQMRSEAINGPTQSHGLPAFSWTKWENVTHVGLPEVYTFDFVPMQPQF